MSTLVTITDLTRMSGTRVCVAGYRPDQTCVRPVFQDGPVLENWVYLDGSVRCRPFAQVSLNLLRQPRDLQAPHLEDWYVSRTYSFVRNLTRAESRSFLLSILDPSVRSIFGTELQRRYDSDLSARFVAPGTGNRSLGTIRTRAIVGVIYETKEGGKIDYRLTFRDADFAMYRAPVTDLAFRNYLDHLCRVRGSQEAARLEMQQTLRGREVFLRLGLARAWNGGCYLQINGVHTFPDYLDGRCFADFVDKSDAVWNDLDDVPF